MRLLAFGGWGQLGTDLHARAEERSHQMTRPRHADADVTDEASIRRAVEEAGPDAVFDLAAFHRVEACEEQPGLALQVNAVGAWNVARAAAAAGARCCYVSSDYVFSGQSEGGYREEDPTGPVNVYGASKAAGEWLTRMACPDSIVARGSGLFGHAGSSGKGGNFVETMLAGAASGRPMSVVDDLVFSPTSTWDMAGRMLDLLERGAPPGTYHLANAGSCSWFEFAAAIFELAGVDADLSPTSSPRDGVRRPRCSVLIDGRTVKVGLPPNRSWRDALAWYLKGRTDPDDTIRAGSRSEEPPPRRSRVESEEPR